MENRNPPLGSRVGAANYCVPGSIPGPGVICGLSVLLVLYSAPRLFSPGTPVFPSPLDVRHLSHEPLARVIAQALPVLDVKFTFFFFTSYERLLWGHIFGHITRKNASQPISSVICAEGGGGGGWRVSPGETCTQRLL